MLNTFSHFFLFFFFLKINHYLLFLAEKGIQFVPVITYNMAAIHLDVRTHDYLLSYGNILHQTQKASTRLWRKSEQQSLTFLASHSCLGRGLLTPIRLSSLGMEGKEKTAERKAHFNQTRQIKANQLSIFKQESATHQLQSRPPLPRSHWLQRPGQTNKKERDDWWRKTERNIYRLLELPRECRTITSPFDRTGSLEYSNYCTVS